MFTLFVSHDSGDSYDEEREAETLDELRPRIDELNKSMLHWYLEKDGENSWEELCDIHKSILTFMDQVISP